LTVGESRFMERERFWFVSNRALCVCRHRRPKFNNIFAERGRQRRGGQSRAAQGPEQRERKAPRERSTENGGEGRWTGGLRVSLPQSRLIILLKYNIDCHKSQASAPTLRKPYHCPLVRLGLPNFPSPHLCI